MENRTNTSCMKSKAIKIPKSENLNKKYFHRAIWKYRGLDYDSLLLNSVHKPQGQKIVWSTIIWRDWHRQRNVFVFSLSCPEICSKVIPFELVAIRVRNVVGLGMMYERKTQTLNNPESWPKFNLIGDDWMDDNFLTVAISRLIISKVDLQLLEPRSKDRKGLEMTMTEFSMKTF